MRESSTARIQRVGLALGGVLVLLLVLLGLAIALGGPQPPPMASIADPFRDVDF